MFNRLLNLFGQPTRNIVGQKLRDHYEIIKNLGSGSFGDTYLAKDLDLPGYPHCVVKHLKPKDPNPAVFPIAKRLFESEARVLYDLGNASHCIPKLYAHFEEGKEFYLVQEFIDGQDLSQEMTPGKRLSESYAVALLQGILEALAVVHQQNVIHRDLKPANLIRRRQDGKIFLIDFGAVKEIPNLVVNEQGQTSVTIAIGTRGYMPTEQAGGKPKLCSDIYAVGMIGIQALTGVLPNNLPQDPHTDNVIWRNLVQVNSQLADILDTMVCNHFRGRYQNAAEALQALALFSGALPLQSSIPQVVVGPFNPSSDPSPSSIPTIVVKPVNPASNPPHHQLPPQPTANLSTFSFTIITVNSRGEVTNRRPGKAQFLQEKLGNGVTLEMVAIPSGTFLMGSPTEEAERMDSEGPQHSVKVTPFFMGKYAVTQGQWEVLMGTNPSRFNGNNRPVENVNWNEATEFCRKLSRMTGRNYRLPSEAEWEYACRAGTTTPFYFGETITSDLANYKGKYIYASERKGTYRGRTTEVGSFPPNAFGLYEMHGNVWEWCQDVWHNNYNGAPSDGSAWEKGGNSQHRLLRGGSWDFDPGYCRAASRGYVSPDDRHNYYGCRVVCAVSRT